MDRTRPMDNMSLDFDLPQEDEIATNVLSAGTSPYLQIAIMKPFAVFKPYFGFGSDCAPEDRERWKSSFLHFMRKVTLRHGHKPLLIKSPVHTARVALLSDLFPEATFIYCHRNPYEVFQSSANMARKYYPYCYLNRPKEEDVLNFIVDQYVELYDLYVRERASLLGRGKVVEVAFLDLDESPVEVVAGIYHHFGWDCADQAAVRVRQYLGSLKDFKKNAHEPLDGASAALVREKWRESFKTFGYKL
mmetsp:Transcript_5903/g.14658  ORF Transcript_5903/g.14658 Transcript_5903/m.14658 type:complete len:247 (-) Transcript_5903:37-777(-)